MLGVGDIPPPRSAFSARHSLRQSHQSCSQPCFWLALKLGSLDTSLSVKSSGKREIRGFLKAKEKGEMLGGLELIVNMNFLLLVRKLTLSSKRH